MSAARHPRTLALAAAAVAALAAYALDARPLAWPLVLLVGLFAFLPWRRAPRPLMALASTFNATVIAAVVLLVALSRHLALVRESFATPLLAAEGVAAALLVTLFFAGREIWPAARHLLPAAATLFVVTGMNPEAPAYLPLAGLAAAAFWAYALASEGPRAGLAHQLAFALPALALAVGLVALLPWAQPHVEAYTARLLANDAASGLSDTTRLGDVSRLALSRRVVLRLWTTPPGGRTWLLRTHVFDRFDGHAWRVPTTVARSPLARSEGGRQPAGRLGTLLAAVPGALFPVEPTARPAEATPYGARVLLSQVLPGALPLPADVTLVKLDDVAPAVNAFGLVRPQFLPPRFYGFASLPETVVDPAAGPAPGAVALPNPAPRAAPRGSPPAPSAIAPEAALALPARLDPRTLALALRLAREAESRASGRPPADVASEPPGHGPRDDAALAFARLEHTLAHLHRGYRYTLEPGAFTGQDPLAEFLFVKRQAYCEYFATAAAILLRLQGVPTRYVKGLSAGAHNRVGDHHVVREADAHAWIEAWIPGRGWLEADPTPPAQFAALHAHADPRGLGRALEALAATAQEAWAMLAAADWGGLLALLARTLAALAGWLTSAPLALGALAALLATWLLTRHARSRRRRARVGARRAAPRLSPDLERLGRELEAFWRRLGHPRPPGRGLLEHAARVRAAGASSEGCATGEEAARAYYAAAFGGRPLEPETLGGLGARLRAPR